MRIAPTISYALRLSVLEGSMFGIYWNILLVIVVNGLAVVFDATPFQFALLNALPLLSQLLGIPAAKYMQEKDIRKPLTLIAEGASRVAWFALLIIFVFQNQPELQTWLLIGITAMGHMTHAGGAIGWISWASDLIPEQIRGVYFGVRNAIIGLIGLIGLTLASRWADDFNEPVNSLKKQLTELGSGADRTVILNNLAAATDKYLHVLFLLILIALGFSILSWGLLALQPVRKMKKLVTTGYKAIWDTLTTPNCKRIAITWIAFFFTTGITTGIYIQFFLNRLGMSWMGITAYIWISTILSTAVTPLLGRFMDRFGYRTTLLVAWGGVWWQPLLSVFCPNNAVHLWGLIPLPILIDAIAGGIFWPAVGIAQTNIVIAETQSETRAGFFAVLTAIGGVIGFITAALAGWLATSLGNDIHYNFAGIYLDNLRIPMVIGAVTRMIAGFLIFTIREPARHKGQVTSTEAFTAVWKILVGKPIGGRLR